MKKMSLAASAVLVLCACNRIETPDTASAIRIEPIITKATQTDFETGDKVGLSITRAGSSYADNVLMTYDGQTFSGDLLWYTEGEQNSDFVAYYPYADAVPSTFSVAEDQSSAVAYGASDLMAASKKDVTPQATVAMVFKHLLTRLVIDIDNQAGARIDEVVVSGSAVCATVDIAALSAVKAEGAAAKEIKAACITENSAYSVITVPQDAKMSVKIKVHNGATLSKSLAMTSLKSGGQYRINATILPTDVNVSISSDIENWSDEGVISEKEVTFNEFDTYFEYDGDNYTIATLADGNKWMTQNLHFVPDGKTISATPGDGAGVWYPYSTDGTTTTALTDEESVKANGLFYDFNTLMATTITDDNFDKMEGAQGICPPGWHVPTRAEYYALCGNSNACARLGEAGVQTNPDAKFYVPAYTSGTVGSFNEGGFNFSLCGSIGNNKYSVLKIDSSVCDVEAYYGKPRMAYIATSTANKNTQFFALMTTFTSTNAAGKVSLSFATLSSAGVSLRCVKNK